MGDDLESHLEPRVAALETGVANLSTQMDKVLHSVEGLANHIHKSDRTDWQTVIAGAGLVCVIMGALGSAWIAPTRVLVYQHENKIERLERKVESLRLALTRRSK